MRRSKWGKLISKSLAGALIVGVCQILLLPSTLAQASGYTICGCEEKPLQALCTKACSDPPKEKIKVVFTPDPSPKPGIPALSRSTPDEPGGKTAVTRELERVRKAAEAARARSEVSRKIAESERAGGKLSSDEYRARTEKYRNDMKGYRLLMKDLQATHRGAGGG